MIDNSIDAEIKDHSLGAYGIAWLTPRPRLPSESGITYSGC
jgi:hypothetical protein